MAAAVGRPTPPSRGKLWNTTLSSHPHRRHKRRPWCNGLSFDNLWRQQAWPHPQVRPNNCMGVERAMIDRRMLLNIDWMLVSLVVVLGAWGLTTVYSATHGRLETHLSGLYLKQIYWFAAGLVLMMLITVVD